LICLTGLAAALLLAGQALAATLNPPTLYLPPTPDADGVYRINWGGGISGSTYVLEEATLSDFSNAAAVYSGTYTYRNLSGKAPGTYYYRIKATKAGYTDSAYRNGAYGIVVLNPATVPVNAVSTIYVPATDADGKYRVYWKASATSGSSYTLQEATDAGFSANVVTYPSSSATYRDIAGKTSGSYYYRVQATKTGNAPSAWTTGSNAVVVTLPIGSTTCLTCHSGGAGGTQGTIWAASRHGNGNSKPGATAATGTCARCHNASNEYATLGRPAVGCESCHGTQGGVDHPTQDIARIGNIVKTCGACHNAHGSADRTIATKVKASRHNGATKNSSSKCQRCHTTEGSIAFAAYTGDKNTMNTLTDPIIATTEVQAVTCAACHDSHTGGLRAVAGWDPNGNGQADQFDLCTSCHTLQKADGTIVASGLNGTAPFYHDTAWYRIIATTHYDNPATGFVGSSGETSTLIEGYVIRKNGANPCFDCHGHELTTNTRQNETPPRPATIHTDWAKSAHAGGLLNAKYAAAKDPNTGAWLTTTAALTDTIMNTGITATGEAWTHYNWDRTGRSSCQRCHTATGAANYLSNPATYNATNNDFSHLAGWSANPANGSAQNEVLYCWGCHSNVGSGALRNPGAFTLSFTVMAGGGSTAIADAGKSNTCIACHSGRASGASITSADFTSTGRFPSPHYLGAAGTLNNYLGYHFAGRSYTGGGHKNVGGAADGPCVTCHMSNGTGHTFEAVAKDVNGNITAVTSTACAGCHANPLATIQGAEAEVHAALDALKAALAQYAGAYYDAATGQFTTTDGGSTQKTVYASIDQLGAAFNFYLLDHAEAGAFVHNSTYALKLIADSIDFLYDNQVDGDVAEAIDSLTALSGEAKLEAKESLDLVSLQAALVDQGDSTLAPPAGYAGSNACKNCHDKEFAGWSNSNHNKPTKYLANQGESIIVNDSDNDGLNDFVEVLDFNDLNFATTYGYTNPFASRIPNAPILKKVGADYIIQIGSVEYKINRTQGGNGYWKQRYYTKVGGANYVLPIQYNEVLRRYSAYNPQYWYVANAAGDSITVNGSTVTADATHVRTPLFDATHGSAEQLTQFKIRLGTLAGTITTAVGSVPAAANGPASSSWENRCAGCHQGNVQVQLVNGEVVSGYNEINIGCEACHGPGAAHAAAPTGSNIINPNDYLASVGGAYQATETCGKCHMRGEGKGKFGEGVTKNMEAPSLNNPDTAATTAANTPISLFALGQNLVNYIATNNPTPWGTKTNDRAYRTTSTFPNYVASSGHHQQWEDLEQGNHGAHYAEVNGTQKMACWTCHDLHQPAGKHNIRTSMTVDGVSLAVSALDNTLCLSCHAGENDFAGLTVAQLKADPTGADVLGAVNAHLTSLTGAPGKTPLSGATYLATVATYGLNSYKNGQCVSCHMPYTVSSSGIRFADAGSVVAGGTNRQQGDMRNHTMKAITADIPGAATAPTSCTGCH
jgi:formate-dependent nitrite reductase cytochrome c552 subunit